MCNYDVYSYGVISTSRLIRIEGEFPKADHYAEMDSQYKMTGGEAANSSIALSRLDVRVKLDGNWLGNNADERSTLDLLKEFGIDTTRITLKDQFMGPNEVVVADPKTRTIFGNYGKVFGNGQNWNAVQEEDIKEARVICLDPFFGPDSLQVASFCKKHDKPYVTVDCPYDSNIAQNAEVVIIAGEYRSHHYRDVDVDALFDTYVNCCSGLVIFTFGGETIYYRRKGGQIHTISPYAIESIDTAGAGDSFRSGIIYGLLNGYSDEAMIRYGSAVSALVCMSFPGVMMAPTTEEVELFMAGWDATIE